MINDIESIRNAYQGTTRCESRDDEKPAYKLTSDSRVTRVGRILRRLSLDEIPQLLKCASWRHEHRWPTTAIPYEVEAYELWHRKRLDMKPGLTGLWQVSAGIALTSKNGSPRPLHIENWSLLPRPEDYSSNASRDAQRPTMLTKSHYSRRTSSIDKLSPMPF